MEFLGRRFTRAGDGAEAFASTPPILRPSGRYHFPITRRGGGGTTALSADVLYMMPFCRPRLSMSALVFEVTTTGTATLANIGLFTTSEDGATWSLLEGVNAIDVSGAAEKVVNLAAARIIDGPFWGGVHFNGTVTCRTGVDTSDGPWAVNGSSGLSGTATTAGLTRNASFAGGLPASFTNPSPSNVPPLIAVKAA